MVRYVTIIEKSTFLELYIWNVSEIIPHIGYKKTHKNQKIEGLI